MAHSHLFIVLACSFGFFMAWGIGANDVANAMGTSVGSKALSIKQALIVAAIFETAGAILAGGQVTATIRNGIVDPNLFASTPEIFIYGMLAALLAAGVWLLVASYFGWPVSTTHSIVGAIIGFGLVNLHAHSIHWGVVVTIALSWVVTPIIAGIIAYLVFISIRQLIFYGPDPAARVTIVMPFYVLVVAFVISLVTFTKGLQHLTVHIDVADSVLYSCIIGVVVMLVSWGLLQRRHRKFGKQQDIHMIEKYFGLMMVFTACAMAFAHGSNDIANAIGPLAAIISVVQSGGSLAANTPLPPWILFFGAAGIVAGLGMYGHKVIATIGTQITSLTPSRGFAASLATAMTVVIASGTGLPISTTQTLVGAVLGVGLARGFAALNLNVVRNVFMSWVVTLPAGAALAIIFFYLIKAAMQFV